MVSEILALVMEENTRKIDKHLCTCIGEEAWNKLSDQEKHEAQIYIWAGCCMHKKMNSVKGEGAIKLTSLASVIFNHKDGKKGQQDTLRALKNSLVPEVIFCIFFECNLRYLVEFPDTSNICFQSHYKAATAILVNLSFYLNFLLLSNVLTGLKDIPTLTELCVLSLYSISLSHPYLRVVRSFRDQSINALELRPLHEKVKAHCQTMISNLALLLASDADHRLSSSLPHLEKCLVAFFKGALETWKYFTSEFCADGAIAGLSKEEKQQIYIVPTNAHCSASNGLREDTVELGFLGGGRRWSCWLSMPGYTVKLYDSRPSRIHAPNISLHCFNSETAIRRNNTAGYMKIVLTPADRKFFCKENHHRDALGLERKRRWEQADHDQAMMDTKRT
ncbi:hypothetical protein Hypma_000161 [Hypsizygus marmoreus]|uniref:Uncharacterized protein n=1 Tax=Hypsizygus marmoreus TaxID=39966 RepID=A0A369KJ96_HYPMA|nr:hypothetical protein Hypma_000161 [Hypsizygus marmoreus]